MAAQLKVLWGQITGVDPAKKNQTLVPASVKVRRPYLPAAGAAAPQCQDSSHMSKTLLKRLRSQIEDARLKFLSSFLGKAVLFYALYLIFINQARAHGPPIPRT
jgi:hypothetical protein